MPKPTLNLVLSFILLLSIYLTLTKDALTSTTTTTSATQFQVSQLASPTSELSSSTSTRRSTPVEKSVNLVYALLGENGAQTREFEVSLKSVIFNSPINAPLNIFFVCDSDGVKVVKSVMESSGLNLAVLNGKRRLQTITFKTLNINSLIPTWTEKLKKRVNTNLTEKHTFGTYLRLFLNETPIRELDHVIYSDTDVVFVTNLQKLWSHRDPSKFLQWGSTKCAGLILMSPKLMGSFFWDYVGESIRKDNAELNKKYPNGLDDQMILTSVERYHPDMVGKLPDQWDVHLGNGKSKLGVDGLVDNMTEGAGFLHFNGGGKSPKPFFENEAKDWQFLKKSDYINGDGWRLAHFFVDLPWRWLLFGEESKVDFEREGDGEQVGNYVILEEWVGRP